jgi:hypothetical protein
MPISDDFFKDLAAKGKSLDIEGLFRDLLGMDPKPAEKSGPLTEQAREALRELKHLTTDGTDDEVLTRALMVYLAVVKHTKAGGTVRFVGSEKVLKVRFRP